MTTPEFGAPVVAMLPLSRGRFPAAIVKLNGQHCVAEVIPATTSEALSRAIRHLNASPPHPHVLPHVKFSETNSVIYRPLADYGSLDRLLGLLDGRSAAERGRLAVAVAVQALLGLVYHLHVFGRSHLDVKPENLLVHGDGRVELCGFDTSRTADEESGAADLGTGFYRAPENGGDTLELPRRDVWSVGVVGAVLALGEDAVRRSTSAGHQEAIDAQMEGAADAADIPWWDFLFCGFLRCAREGRVSLEEAAAECLVLFHPESKFSTMSPTGVDKSACAFLGKANAAATPGHAFEVVRAHLETLYAECVGASSEVDDKERQRALKARLEEINSELIALTKPFADVVADLCRACRLKTLREQCGITDDCRPYSGPS